MADDADVQAPDITPEDFMADEQETVKVAPSTTPEAKAEAKAEDKKPEAVEADKPEVKDEAKPDEAKLEEPPEVKPEDEDKPEDKPLSDTLVAPKSENRYQKLANENRELRERVEKLTSDTYAPQTVEELTSIVNPETGEFYTVPQAAQAALNQQLQMRDYNDRAVNAQRTVGTESWEILNELPIFNPQSDSYDSELAAIAAETLEGNLIRDDNMPEIIDGKPTGRGTIVDFRQSPKQIYQTLARASGISAAKGQMQGQKDTETMLANADTASSAAPPAKKADPLAELWEAPL